MRILQSLAHRMEMFFPESRVYNPTGMVRDFSNQIHRELDFVRDGKNADRLRHNLRDFEGVSVPRVYWEHSGTRLLVMEYVEGVRVDDIEGIRDLGVRPRDIAERGFSCYLAQIFDHGFFHADPHPGNLLVTPRGDLTFLDFGIFGVVRPERQRAYMEFLNAMVEGDADIFVESMERLGIHIQKEDRDAFKDEVYMALIDFRSFELGEYDMQSSLAHITESMRQFQLQVPLPLMRMIKVILMVTDIGLALSPTFDFVAHVRPYLERLGREKMVSEDLLRRASHSARNAVEGLIDLPGRVNETLERVSRGSIRLELVDTDIKQLQESLDRTSDKILVGMVTAAVVVGSSLILLATNITVPPWISMVAIFGYVAALLIGLYALYHVLTRRTIG
ncbi:MAG: ABC1 kinase family protein [Methanomicrobiales archaeon]